MDEKKNLHTASRNGDVSAVKRLVNVEKIDVNSRDRHNRTPLHLAAWAGHHQVAQFLCENKASVGLTASDEMSALHFSCQKGHLEVARVLFAAGAKATNPTRKGQSPLHFAVQTGNEALIKLVFRKAPEMRNFKNKRGELPSDLATDQIKTLLLTLQKESLDKDSEKQKKTEEKKAKKLDASVGRKWQPPSDNFIDEEEEETLDILPKKEEIKNAENSLKGNVRKEELSEEREVKRSRVDNTDDLENS